MTVLRMEQVSFTYPDGTTALRTFDLSFEKGERVAIIGQNGAGKTTAVKLMNGLLKPISGDVFLGDWNTKDFTTAKLSKRVGYVFQNPDDQIFHSDVYAEIAFGPRNLGWSDIEIKEHVEYAAKLTGMKDVMKENPYDLPYSTRKFVTLASVIAMDPDIIIMDEPTAGQDMIGLQQIGYLLDALQEKGKTVITITHDMDFVVRHFERVIVMAQGEKIADGMQRDIFWNPTILEKSMLKPPFYASLGQELGLKEPVLTKEELMEHILLEKR
ncbi:energy-coupling factor ABC transporter ATP-binding protein [Radiobacillus kanasensis]|uniref:energy-coupling factor ABC transporter ATP-binding protein n=1 Tax=Radiobacillus kanasensis TaxID=2844358 RepID=UPI001E46D7CC|nr:ABC transporter ATP-binding protein [Radiobacillus kanasensis]UFT98698.1 energy-coupling factor ABC transporter ATP-binding protein [Radiobacillus kanasensis]